MKLIPLLAASLGMTAVWGEAHGQTCTTSSSGLAFGNYSTLADSDDDAAGTITISCTSATAVSVAYTLQLGTGSSGSYAARALTGAVLSLQYQLYTDSAHSIVWGDGTTAGTSSISDGYSLSGNTTNRSYTVYGKLSAHQSVTAGTYTDIIQVIVNY
jgi:spore coat protein U-like protein